MLERRRVALAGLEDGDGDLLVEWSAPADAKLEDVDAWRLASPHWTPKRERLIAKAAAGGEAGRGRPGGRGARPRAVLPLAVAEPVAGQADGAAGEHGRPAPARALGLARGVRARLRPADRRARGRLRPRGGSRLLLAPAGTVGSPSTAGRARTGTRPSSTSSACTPPAPSRSSTSAPPCSTACRGRAGRRARSGWPRPGPGSPSSATWPRRGCWRTRTRPSWTRRSRRRRSASRRWAS